MWSVGMGTENVGMGAAKRNGGSCDMNMRFGCVCKLFLRMYSAKRWLSLYLFVPTPGFISPGIRHMECKWDVQCILHNGISSVFTVSLIRFH